MLDYNFLSSVMKEASYKLKENTKISYYRTSGTAILPKRLSISRESEITRVARKGRNLLHSIAGQMVGAFTQKEYSPLKIFKPYTCRTQIWWVDEYPLLIGYGTTGITNEKGKISDTRDLVIFYTPDQWNTIQIYFFRGLGNPDNLIQCMEFVNNLIKKEMSQPYSQLKGRIQND